MPVVKIASFNVENLFDRAKLLNKDNAEAKPFLDKVEKLRDELDKQAYNKPKILSLVKELNLYIEIVEVRRKLLNSDQTKVLANGVDDWGGFIDLKREKLTDKAKSNTAEVLRRLNADICCLVEVENRPVLKHFCIEQLDQPGTFKNYKHIMLVDGNDPRGIDVALASRYPIGTMISHVDDADADGTIFSRDCLELEVALPGNKKLWMLLNHFKSQGHGSKTENDARRLRQTERVAKILKRFDLKKDMVIVCGDFNDTLEDTASQPPKPLDPLIMKNLYNVHKLKFSDVKDRWTYIFNNQGQQIDYMLISEPLKTAFKDAGFERGGIFGVDKFTKGAIKPFPGVTAETNSASDHAAIWAEFNL